MRFLLTLTVVLATACAQKAPKPPEGGRSGVFIGYKSTPQDKERDAALNKTAIVPMSDDELTIKIYFQLPEVSIATREKMAKKFGTNFDKDDGVHPYNGHLCFQGDIKSKEQKDYSKTAWSATVFVNGKKTPHTLTANPTPVLNLNNGQNRLLSGRTTVRLCTDKKFFNGVKKVKLILSADKKKLTEMDWSAPWPTTEIGEPEQFNFNR
ncbi:hypothetical protein [Bdellovibrio bacteriovorus]|uniref:hypothetical protein n=1 Tax=Bdellovibrio bacteriovorus TaxID=959 RepID=UPI0018E05715|nr:hypothetical protein [Bdellovibrio bacteriovorus]